MNLRTRRIIFAFFLIVFFILAPLIVVYSFGVRFDFKTKNIIETGVVTIDSTPSKAFIQLNGVVQKQKTPAKFTRLLSGEYTLELSRPGYYTWSSDASVRAGQAVVFDQVFLLKHLEPRLLLKGAIVHLSKLNMEQYLVLEKLNEQQFALSIFVPDINFTAVTSIRSSSVPEIYCSGETNQCVIASVLSEKQSFTLISYGDRIETSVLQNNGDALSHIQYVHTSGMWLGLASGALQELDFVQQTIRPYLSLTEPMEDFVVYENQLTLLTNTSIETIDMKNPRADFSRILTNQQYTALTFMRGLVFLTNHSAGSLGVYRPGDQTVLQYPIHAYGAEYIVKAKAFVFWNNNELWFLQDDFSSEPMLALRTSGIVEKLQVNSHYPYLTYLHDHRLTFRESLRKDPFTQALAASPVRDFTFADNGKTVLFTTDEGLFSQMIF